jgi:hypothetical protein
VRNGTQNLFAALQEHSGEVSGMTAPTRDQFEFWAHSVACPGLEAPKAPADNPITIGTPASVKLRPI